MFDSLPLQHREKFAAAYRACETRESFSAWPENPSSKLHGEERPRLAKERFEAMLGKPFELDQPAGIGRLGEEVSPYTRKPLGISYPRVDVEALYRAVNLARDIWTRTDPDTRVGVCMDILERCADQLFENAHATMHTSGQSYVMAFAGSGANALDRGLEALVYAKKAMDDVPRQGRWQRQFGRDGLADLDKHYRIMPRGIAVVICCATFPLWNAYPAVCASLATGNPVVLKPHPNAILPVAMMVRAARQALGDAGYDPNLVTLVADTRSEPATHALLEQDDTAIVDFTGSPVFGEWLENNLPGRQVYTETAGCNSVILESSNDLQATASAIAQSLCQASAQMCTSVQNIHIPAEGVKVGDDTISFEDVSVEICAAVDRWLSDGRRAATLCGTLFDDSVQDTVDRYRAMAGGRVLRDSTALHYPEFPDARTASPLIISATRRDRNWYAREVFGPVSFLIRNGSAAECLADATRNARECGAITSHVYSVNDAFLEQAVDAYHAAGASVACNLHGMPINFAAAYSDYHVTGLNPAGNACLADLAFVANRFRIVQAKFQRRA